MKMYKMSFDQKIKWLKAWKDLKDLLLLLFLFNLLINNLLGRVQVINDIVSVFTASEKVVIINTMPKVAKAEVKKEIEQPKVKSVVELADIIYTNESSRGKNNYTKCEALGKVNTIGYGIDGSGKFQCFDSHAEEMATLTDWIERHKAEGMTENEMLCHYSGNNYAICQ